MNSLAMPHDIRMRGHERLQRCRDRKEVNVGDEPVDAGIDAARFGPMDITIRWDQVREHPQVRQSARIGLIRRVAPDALEIITLRVVFPGLVQAGLVDLRMLRNEAVAKRWKIT